VEGGAVLGRLEWRPATVLQVLEETPRARTLILDVPGWPGHIAGQHLDVRLTAPDGYRAERSYSIASPPEAPTLALTVERIEDGEVSPYLCGVARPGDRFEVRGPIGGYFVWHRDVTGPLLLVAGGSGIVPLMAMLRHRDASGGTEPAALLHSCRSPADAIYAGELGRLAASPTGPLVRHTYTRQAPPGWSGARRRVDRALLAGLGLPPALGTQAYVCGPTGFVEAAASALTELGHPPGRIRTERFGPSGTAPGDHA